MTYTHDPSHTEQGSTEELFAQPGAVREAQPGDQHCTEQKKNACVYAFRLYKRFCETFRCSICAKFGH